MRQGLMLLNAFTWSKAKDNGAGIARRTRTATSRRRRTSTTSTPTTARRPTTSRSTTRPASCGRSRLAAASGGWRTPARSPKRLLGGWTLSGINTMTSGEPVTLFYQPAASFQVSGITAGLPRRQQLPAERRRRSVRRPRFGDRLPQSRYRRRPRRTPASRSATRRGTASAARGSGRWISSRRRTSRCPSATRHASRFASRRSTCSTRPTSAPRMRNRSRRELRHHHVHLRRASAAARCEVDVLTMAGHARLSAARWCSFWRLPSACRCRPSGKRR